MLEKYNSLLQDFLNIAEPFVNSDVLDQLKYYYENNIDSKRKLSKINNLETFLKLLEKRDILSYDNIEPFWYIWKNYIRRPDMEVKLQEYEYWLQTAPSFPYYNMHQSDYTSVSLQEQSDIVNNENLIFSKLQNTCSFVQNLQKSNCSEQKRKKDNRRELLQQAVLLEVSERLGRAWRDVARHLGIRECEIDAVQNKYPYDMKEQSHEILKIYISKYSGERWALNLMRALDKGRRKDLKQYVEELVINYKDI